jgi:hypothetical protein
MITPGICQRCPGANIDMGFVIRVPYSGWDRHIRRCDELLPARGLYVRETLRVFELREDE